MSSTVTRRGALRSAAGTLLGVGNLAFLPQLRPVSAAEVQLDPDTVRFDPSIEPVVRLLEETPREQLLEEMAARIRRGLSYREILAALLLAGVKNVEPRPSVGHKFHAVLVVNSAHLASMSSPPEHRWLPIFWALDHYKSAEARDVEERGDWTMGPAVDSAIPPPHKSRQAFAQAMDRWDEEAADAAIAGLARTAGANEVFEQLVRYGVRDFRSIGHKAIFVANSYRTLSCIGWRHAEPVLRSLVYALLMHEGGNPAERDDDADRPYRRNQQLAGDLRSDWRTGRIDEGATSALLETLRTGSNDAACDHVVELINGGVAPKSIWDALHLGAGELLMRQSGIVALHAVTSTNAIYFAFQTSSDDQTRRLLMLQNAAFLPMFRAGMHSRGDVREVKITDLQPQVPGDSDPETVETVFAELSRDPLSAAELALGYLRQDGPHQLRAKELIDAARLLVFLKGTNAHDYKFSSAILEDYYHVSPPWRDAYLAANILKLRGSLDPDNDLVNRTRAALNV